MKIEALSGGVRFYSVILFIIFLSNINPCIARTERIPAHPEALITKDKIKVYQNRYNATILDASDTEDKTYVPKTIEDAIHVPYRDLRKDSGLIKGITFGLEEKDFDATFLKDIFRRAGVCNNKPVIVVSQFRVDDACYLFWVLKWLGHKKVRLYPLNYLKTLSRSMLTYSVDKWSDNDRVGDFKAHPQWFWYATRDDILSAIHSPNIALWDTRTKEFFCGTKSKTIRGGSVATAKNWPFYSIWQDRSMSQLDWSMISKKLKQLFSDPNSQTEGANTIITICNTGHCSTVGVFAWQCGYKWKNFDAGWNFMAYDGTLPVINIKN